LGEKARHWEFAIYQPSHEFNAALADPAAGSAKLATATAGTRLVGP